MNSNLNNYNNILQNINVVPAFDRPWIPGILTIIARNLTGNNEHPAKPCNADIIVKSLSPNMSDAIQNLAKTYEADPMIFIYGLLMIASSIVGGSRTINKTRSHYVMYKKISGCIYGAFIGSSRYKTILKSILNYIPKEHVMDHYSFPTLVKRLARNKVGITIRNDYSRRFSLKAMDTFKYAFNNKILEYEDKKRDHIYMAFDPGITLSSLMTKKLLRPYFPLNYDGMCFMARHMILFSESYSKKDFTGLSIEHQNLLENIVVKLMPIGNKHEEIDEEYDYIRLIRHELHLSAGAIEILYDMYNFIGPKLEAPGVHFHQISHVVPWAFEKNTTPPDLIINESDIHAGTLRLRAVANGLSQLQPHKTYVKKHI